jgi:hypothetical protein
VNGLETVISFGALAAVGSPLVIGIALIILFVGIAVAAKLDILAGAIIIIPGMLWVFDNVPTMSPLRILAALAIASVFSMALLRFIKVR